MDRCRLRVVGQSLEITGQLAMSKRNTDLGAALLVVFDMAITKPDDAEPTALQGDFQLLVRPDGAALRVQAGDQGDLLFVATTSILGFSAANGIWQCDLAQRQCENDTGDTISY